MPKIKVIVAEDHTVVRQGLKALIQADPDLQVAAEASDGASAVALTRELKPDVVVMDIAMPQMNGLEATRRICADAPASRVLVLSCYSDDESVESLLQAGAVGFITKHSASVDLLEAIRHASRGEQFLSAKIAERIRRRKSASRAARPRFATDLSRRQTQVLTCLAAGMASKSIATELGISCKTVEKHRQAIMSKLDIHDIASLTRYATARGFMLPCPAQSSAHSQPT